MSKDENFVPVYEKYALSIPEAANYFGIGQKKLRLMAEEYPDEGFVLQNGTKLLIKRIPCAEFLNKRSTI